jgi:hypothetical protein
MSLLNNTLQGCGNFEWSDKLGHKDSLIIQTIRKLPPCILNRILFILVIISNKYQINIK